MDCRSCQHRPANAHPRPPDHRGDVPQSDTGLRTQGRGIPHDPAPCPLVPISMTTVVPISIDTGSLTGSRCRFSIG